MFEGKELEGKIGNFGEYAVDVTEKGTLKASVSIEVDIIAELEKAAAKTQTPMDDMAMAWVKKVLGR